MKKLLFCVVALLVLFSCDFFDFENELKGNFWAYDSGKDSYYRVDAELLYTGTRCTVWAEKGSVVTLSDAQEIANAYDNDIYPKMIGAFGSQLIFSGLNFSDPMELADKLSYAHFQDGKLCILFLDIKDNYNPPSNPSFIAGYFDNINFLSRLQYESNGRDMIYIDTYPGLTPSESSSREYLLDEAKKTIAHEMQHLMNFIFSVVYRSQTENEKLIVYAMDTWIDEGLSSAAEYIYSGGHSESRIDWFNSNGWQGESKINLGNNFFVWGNRDALLDDYATVYLFFQWLRLQTGSTNIYKDIITSPNFDHLAVVNAINDYSDWETLLKTWLAANYIRSSTGQYGYKDDSELNAITTHYAPANPSILLSPGEGVYSVTNSNGSTPALGNKIRYAGLDRNAFQVSNSNVYANGVLLTYNVNTDNKGAQESGVTTGVTASITSAKSGSASRSVTAPLSRPIPIGAGDLLKRAEPFVFEFPINGNAADE